MHKAQPIEHHRFDGVAHSDHSGLWSLPQRLVEYVANAEFVVHPSDKAEDVEKLAQPFHYGLCTHAERQTCQLLGLHVQTRCVYDDDGRRDMICRAQTNYRSIAVIWRETESWQGKGYERDKDFRATPKLQDGADEAVANGDAVIPNAPALESIFKALMCAPVEAGR